MAFESYIKEYSKLLEMVRKETYEKYQTETAMLQISIRSKNRLSFLGR